MATNAQVLQFACGLAILATVITGVLTRYFRQHFAAIEENEILAESLGLVVWRYKALGFVVAAGIAGLAGYALVNMLLTAHPTSFDCFWRCVSSDPLGLLIGNTHQPESIGGMGRPVMLRPQADRPGLVLLLVILQRQRMALLDMQDLTDVAVGDRPDQLVAPRFVDGLHAHRNIHRIIFSVCL